MPLSLMSAPAIAQGPTPPPTTSPTPETPPSAPATPTSKALAQAKKDNRRIEIESLRSETATYYANPDGKTLRLEQYLEPIRVKNAGGDGFTPIDTTLVKADGVIKPRTAKGGLTLSSGGDTEAIKSKSGDMAARIDAPRTLPKPTLNGSTATYSSAYGKGVDLVVTATPTGFRQQIVIRQRPAGPVTFRVPVDLPKGIAFGKNAKGQPALKSEDGKRSLDIRPAALLDAAAADANADLGAVRVGRAQVSLDGSALVYSPDPAFLADPATTYPVTMAAVDDDWYECTLGTPCPPGDPMDTYINDVDLTDSWDMHYRDQMWVGKSYSSNIAKRWRAYIQFPLPQAGDPFWGSVIQNADLELWNYLSNDCGEFVGSGITARRVTSDWDHLTLQWNSQPSVTSAGADNEPGAYSPDCSGSMNYEHDLIHSVDTIVQAWADGETNYGFQLTAGDESELRNWRRYRSREQTSGYPAHGPRLKVDFEPPTPPWQDTVVITSREPLTSFPEYEEALTRSVHVPETIESIASLAMSEEDVAANGQYRDGEGSFIGTDKISPSVPYPGDGDDTDDSDGEDTASPRVRTTEPASEAADVPLDSQIRVTFTEEVDGPTISVKSAQGADVQGTTALDSTGETATFTPAQPLRPGTKYTVEVSEATDAWENVMMFPYTWSFRTVDQAAAHWTFDEGNGRTAADSSGNDHHASLNDTAAWIAGKNGDAVSNVPSQARIATSRSAAKQGKAVEVADETTATSITYAQPDGKTFQTEVTAGPVRTRQGSVWAPIDTSLAEQGGTLKPKAIDAEVDVEVSTGGTGAFVRMTADGRRYALTWPATLPKPTVKGNVATYTDAAGKGADLVVTVLPTGFRHDVVLRERPAKPLEIRIGVQTEGLTLSEGKGGRLLLTGGKDKRLVASAPQPVMWDAGAKSRLTKGRLPKARSAKIATDVVTTGGRTELVLKPDHAFLSDPATVYPVRVDPTTTLPFNHDVEVSTNVDLPTDPTAAFMMAGTQIGNQKFRVHLRFDTAALTGATVSDAKLSLNNIDAPACGAAVGAGIQVRRLTGAWDENNLSWTNKPASTTEDAQINRAGINESCATWPGSMDWNVTGIAQDWAVGAANHGLVLQSPTETNVNNYRAFTSSEDTDFNNPPKLTVTTTGPASAPAVSNLTITPAQAAGGVTTVTSLTPQLAATVSDTIGGTLTGEFEIEHDPAATEQGTGQIWTGSSAPVASGNQATAAVPAGKLTDGWKIRWRARAANTTATTVSAWSAWQTATVDVPNPAVGAFQVTPSQQVNGITVTTSLTPTLHTMVTDPAAQPLRAEVEVEHDPTAAGQGSGQIWAGSLDNVASGSQASFAVSAGKLTDGWKVRWRVRAVNTATTVGSPWSDWQALTIDVPDPASEPAVGALQVTPSQQVDGTTVTPTLTPSLLAQVSDPASRPLRAEAEIEHDPAAPDGQGTGQIWAGSAANVPAGTQATIAVPADKLADGWKVRWRARAVSATAASAWSDWQSFTVDLPKPTATGLTVTPSKVVDGVTVTTTLTPTLQATLTHPTGQALRAEAEIEHDLAAPPGQGTGQIWTGGVDDIVSGTQAGIAVPAAKLSDGWLVRWRARAVAGQVSSAWSDWQQVTVDVTQPGEEPLAQTAGSVIRTDESFTAAAWLRWSDKDGDYTVVEQKGTHQAPFRLGNTPDHGLVFTLTSADTADAAVQGVQSDVEPPVNEWFHLAGVYDAETDTATLYLNGVQIGTAPVGFPAWNAATAMTLGTSVLGDLDETRVYQRPLSAADVAGMVASATAPATLAAAPTVQKEAGPIPAAAQAGGFDYQHPKLEDCTVSGSETGYAEYDARIQERPYSSCWSAYLYIQHYVEEEDDDGVKRKKKAFKTGPVWFALAQSVADAAIAVQNDDTLRFRATWVAHSYLGNENGTGVVDGGTTGVKPHDIKVFTRLDEFAIVDNGGRVKVPGNKLRGLFMDMLVDADAKDEGDCDTGDPGGIRDISGWVANSDENFLIQAEGSPTHNTICSFIPQISLHANGPGNFMNMPLYSQKVFDGSGKLIGVLRKGSEPGENKRWVPNFRCDWRIFGDNNPDVPDRKYACVNTRAKQVFVMSKSRDTDWPEVTRHIEAALKIDNKGTFPPLRPGHDWTKPSYPPTRDILGTEQNKVMPGNWGAPGGNNPAGAPLTRGITAVTNTENRLHFQQIDLYMDQGTSKANAWLLANVYKPYSINTCKYYERDKYPNPGDPLVLPYRRDLSCDEFPFASSMEGAKRAKGNYSLRVVNTLQNGLHGTQIWKFYADFRVGDGNKFWVLIED
ncbi:hypothetical protein GCM10009525_55370 [Streptosporangium amethystogenes subsp. fukuiense]